MFTTLITDSSISIDFYKDYLLKIDFEISEIINLDKPTKNNVVKNIICLIDIRNKESLEKLENLNFQTNSFLIFIIPFFEKFVQASKFVDNSNYYVIQKPLDFEKLKFILQECKSGFKQQQYLENKENLLIHMVDDSVLRIASFNIKGKLVYANKQYLNANKIDDIFVNILFDELINCKVNFNEILHHLKTHQYFVIKKEQDNKWHKSYFYYTKDRTNVVHVCMDITSERQELDKLKKTSEFFEQTNEAVIITDQFSKIIAVNRAFCSITGYTKDEAIGKRTNILKSGVHEKSFYENLWLSLEHHNKWQGEIWNKRKNGEIYPEWLSISKFIDYDTKEINYMAIFTDISSLKEADKKLHFYANHDHLTGLLNRIQFENMINHTIQSSARNHKKFALLFIDLDYFKDVNDTYGHDVGDLVLKEVASRIRNHLRKEDIVARIGGDEFNAVITDIKEESDVISIANNINEIIKKPIVVKEKTFYLSLSIGISLYPKHGIDTVSLSKNADQAMYEVKKNGRDGVLLYDTTFSADLINKVTLKNDLKKAIEAEELEVYYQPVFNLKDKKLFGAEALVRWNHHKKGFISPEIFIQVAERHAMINALGKLVVQKVYEDIPLILNQFGLDFKVAINISSKEFAQVDYVSDIIQTTKDFNIDFKNIELEITETYIMQNHEEAVNKMLQLKEAGFSLAIDDFGTGYSSLSYLKTFPIDKLKIDKSFVLDILKDEDDKAIVKTILSIAKVFDLEVQAEGVETVSHLNMLQKLGCDIAQGYYYSKPIPLEKLLKFKENLDV